MTDFGAFSLTYQRAIYNALSGDVRRLLWRQHLVAYLDRTPSLNTEQHTFVVHILSELEQVVADRSSPGLPNAMRTERLSAQILRAFTPAQARDLFAAPGLAASAALAHAAARHDGSPATTARAFRAGNALLACECWTGDATANCGFVGQTCVDDDHCQHTQFGCGWFNDKPCNGDCKQALAADAELRHRG